jgi:hypothetical protein
LDTLSKLNLSGAGCPSLVMRDYAEYVTLPFLAAFDVLQGPKSSTPPKRVTYIALCKKTMPLLVEHVIKFKDRLEIYADGTMEVVVAVSFSKPIHPGN